MSRRAEGISPTCKPSVFLSCSLTPRQAQGELFSSSAWNVQSLSQSRMFSPQGAAFPPLQQESASARRSWAAASCVQTKQLAGGLGEPPSYLGSNYISVVTYWFSFSFFLLFQCHIFLLASEKALPPTHLLRENKNKWVVRQKKAAEKCQWYPDRARRSHAESCSHSLPHLCECNSPSGMYFFLLFIFFPISILCLFRKFGQERLQSHIKNITVEKIKMEYYFINR